MNQLEAAHVLETHFNELQRAGDRAAAGMDAAIMASYVKVGLEACFSLRIRVYIRTVHRVTSMSQ